MKITEPFHFEGTDPNSLKRRLERVLFAWRVPRLAYYAAERATPPPTTALTAAELPLWLEILRAAKPVPPRSHLDGLKVYARLHGLRIEDLERYKATDGGVARRRHPSLPQQRLKRRTHPSAAAAICPPRGLRG